MTQTRASGGVSRTESRPEGVDPLDRNSPDIVHVCDELRNPTLPGASPSGASLFVEVLETPQTLGVVDLNIRTNPSLGLLT